MKVYVASAMPTDYPRKLQKPSTAAARVRETADSYILDSGIGDDVSNREVLDLAADLNADYVIAKDYLHEFDKTSASIAKFMDLHADHETDATPMIPIQCQPSRDRWHIDHYKQLDCDATHYVLGGMAVDDVGTDEQIKSIRRFRAHVGPEPHVHGLGVGGGMRFVSRVAGTGWLDSVDCATPEMAGQFGAVLDGRLRQNEVRVMSGEGASKRNYAISEFNSWQIQDVWDREADHAGLAAYQ